MADRPRTISLRKAMVVLMLQAIGMLAIGRWLWEWSGRDAASFVTVSAREALGGGALGLAMIALAFALFRGFPNLGEKLVRMQAETYAVLGPRLGWPAVVFISLCAGIGEEALFRGGLQSVLSDQVGTPLAIASASAAFAIIHLGKPAITALLFVAGAIFGLAYWLTGSLLLVMSGHALYDVWALRYLHSEFLRLGLFDEAAAPLVNPPAEG